MEKSNEIYELICVIVNYGVGDTVLKIAKKNGVRGGTVFTEREQLKEGA